jgi:2'-5' RNA ligase
MPLCFIGIVAPEDISNQVMEWKNYMLQHFGCRVALRSPAHITLVPPFSLNKEVEAKLETDIREFSSAREQFSIVLSNFSSFPPRVIFVDVEPSVHLTNLQKNIEAYVIDKKYPVKQSTRPFHPHITIANRDLREKDYHKAFSHLRTIPFNAVFTATHIDVLKSKPEGWVIASRAPMQTFVM